MLEMISGAKAIWFIIAIRFGIGEVITTGFALIWFSIGALIAMVASIYTDSIMAQVVIFGVSSSIMFIIATKKMVKRDEKYQSNTNIDAIIGKRGVVKEAVGKMTYGIVKLDGETWTAVSLDDTVIQPREIVEVVRIEGVKLVVKKIKQ